MVEQSIGRKVLEYEANRRVSSRVVERVIVDQEESNQEFTKSLVRVLSGKEYSRNQKVRREPRPN